MVIPNLPNSEKGRLRRDGKKLPNQTQNFSTAGFRFILAKTRFPVEKHEDESGAIEPTESPIAARANSPPNSPFGAEGSAGPPNLPNLPFSESGVNQTQVLSRSSKSTVFRIDTNQMHPKCVVLQWCNPLTWQPEQSGRNGFIPGRAPPFVRHDKGSQIRLCDPSAWRQGEINHLEFISLFLPDWH